MNRIKREHIRQLLTPSMLSSLIIMCASLFLIVAAVFISLGRSGHLKNVLFAVNYASHGLNSRYTSIANSLDSNHFISELPLLIFWGIVGLVAYLFAVNVYKAVVSVTSVNNSLHYVHANPHEILKEQAMHLFVRLGSLIVIWVIINRFFHNILPLCLSVVRGVTIGFTYLGGLKLVGLILLLLVTAHLLTIALRLAVIKPRVFG